MKSALLPLRERITFADENEAKDYLSAYRIGIYAVNDQDPNRIYAFTIYPKLKEIMEYFVATTPQGLAGPKT